jgi:hypothetical protein
MTAHVERPGNAKSVVTIRLPEGREILWLASDSPVMSWQIGQAVRFRNRPWVVVNRTEEQKDKQKLLAYTLGVSSVEQPHSFGHGEVARPRTNVGP